jgi:hypothetical protein
VLLAVPLWLALVNLPAPISIEMFDARPMALDYAVRHGIGLGTALPTDVGPLGALLTPTHSGQPVMVNFWCHLLVGAAFALGLAWALGRMAAPARWWMLGALVLIAAFRSEYTYGAVHLVLGLLLLTQAVSRLEAIGAGVLLGLLALINVQFAWLGLLVLLLSRAAASQVAGNVAGLVGVALAATLVAGWFGAGQPAGDLLPWLGHGLVPSSLRYQAAAWSGPTLACGLAAFASILLVVAATARQAASWRTEAVPALFAAVSLCLAWRRATGDPASGPRLFLATAVIAALGWIAFRLSPATRRWLAGTAAAGALAAVVGLGTVEPEILTEPLIRLNRKMVANVAAVAHPSAWAQGLDAAFRGSAALFALPRIQAATAGQRTDLLGNAVAYALVNGLNYAPRPGLQSYRVGDPGLAAQDAAHYAGPTAPQFVVQRLQAFDRALPALEAGPAQLALYANYDFQFEENGFVLWRRRPGAAVSPALGPPVWKTAAAWDQPVTLPVQPSRAYWVTIGASRSAWGWLRRQLLRPADPILLLHDSEGGALSYRAAPENLALGFLLAPLFRSESDLIRYQAGEPPAVIREITLQKPADRSGDFSGPVEIALHEVPAPAVSGLRESADAFAQRFRVAGRLPVAVTSYYPPQKTVTNGKEVLLAHPDSSIEFPVRAGDVSLTGSFGLLDGAYQNGNATDGVEFVIEYVPARGPASVLWRRYLDPLAVAADRGLQSFAVALPQPASGRVILRTQNLPGRNAAWDWSMWTDLRFLPPPASK